MTRSLLALSLVLLAPASALASQATPASDFAELYLLETAEAALDLHLGLAITTPDGSGSWGDHVTFVVDVDGIDPIEAAAIQADLAAGCPAAVPAYVCDDIAGTITDAIVDLNDLALAALPVDARLWVGSYGWLSWLTGIYPAGATHTTAGGDDFALGYLLNNNDGFAHGSILSAGLALGGFASEPGWACADVSVAVVSGQIDQPAGFELEAQFAADRELVCVAGLGKGVAVAGTLGLAWAGAVEGSP